MIPVTVVTRNATQDPVTHDLYRQILADLRAQGMTYRSLAEAMGFSAAMWRFWERGERTLSREAMQALREFTDEFPAMPPTVQEVVAGMVDPDAAVHMIGELAAGELVRRVLLLANVGNVQISANGAITAKTGLDTGEGDRTPVTPVTSTQGARRDKRFRPTVSAENKKWLKAKGLSADAAIERLRQTS